jgi:hypothetical protein
MPSLFWLALGVVFAIIARISVTIITLRRSVPRRRDRTKSCHLAVFLGSGKLDTICNIHHLRAQTAIVFQVVTAARLSRLYLLLISHVIHRGRIW